VPAAVPQGKENKRGRTLTDVPPVAVTTSPQPIRMTDLMISNVWADNGPRRTSLF
jgi:hypothetical protein